MPWQCPPARPPRSGPSAPTQRLAPTSCPLAGKGIKVLKGDAVTALEGAGGRVTTAVLKSGARLEASLVLVGVGARPNTELFGGQLELVAGPPGGIKVNGNLQVGQAERGQRGDGSAGGGSGCIGG